MMFVMQVVSEPSPASNSEPDPKTLINRWIGGLAVIIDDIKGADLFSDPGGVSVKKQPIYLEHVS